MQIESSASEPGDMLMRASNVAVEYDVRDSGGRKAKLRAVDGIDLNVARGQTVGLVGESGCGKSTFGRAIVGLEPLADGSIEIGDEQVGTRGSQRRLELRRRTQMVFQNPQGSLNPRWTIGRSIAEPLLVHSVVEQQKVRPRVAELLDAVGLPASVMGRYPHQLSGGQQQRVAIARALAVGPDLIVCDEPVSALDVSVQAQITSLLSTIQEQTGTAYLFIAHDLAVVRSIADRVAVMYLGRIVEEGASETVFTRPRHPYTIALLSASPTPDASVERERPRLILEGDVPNPLDPPSGCRFRSRCPWATDKCAAEEPPLTGEDSDHAVACHFPEEVFADGKKFVPWAQQS